MPRDPDTRIADARTFLFVPGNRPERIDKALASDADVVIVDLEDAVPPAEKVAARAVVNARLEQARPVLVRVNDAETAWFDDDLRLAGLPGTLGIMLAKAELGPGLDRACSVGPIVALIETARGLTDVQAIASTSGVRRLAFGTIDLGLDLGISDERLLASFGLHLVLASRNARIPAPIDGVTTDFRDLDAVGDAMAASARAGFGAKMCIHPAQVAPVHAALRPSDETLAWARRVMEAARLGDGAAVALDGRMIDKPVIERARCVLNGAGLSVP